MKSAQRALAASLRFLSLLALSLAPTLAQAERFEVHFADQTFEATALARAFARELEERLPSEVKKLLGSGLRLHFAGNEFDRVVPTCQATAEDAKRPKLALGFVRGPAAGSFNSTFDVYLNAGFKRQIALGPVQSTAFPCSHHTGYRLALATALHEAAHLYASHAAPTLLQQEDVRHCESERALSGAVDATCNYVLSHAPSIVSDLRFLSLFWFSPRNLSAESENTWHLRRPDRYETTAPGEAFAVNFEFFLLDPEYPCRRPLEAEAFSRLLHHRPANPGSCMAINNIEIFSLASDFPEARRKPALELERLHSIDFLFADKGPSIQSKWGHALFRLVFCAPGRAPSAECRKDLAHQVVISFRAKVEQTGVDLVKGVTGGYPSMMFAQTMNEVVQEYTHDEFRNLVSLPLRLTREEQKRFLLRTLELFWSYRGRYRYFSNNCATEALKLLNVARGDSGINRRFVASPVDLYETLAREGLIDPGPLANRASAVARSYLIPSYAAQLDRHFQILKARWPGEFARWADVPAFARAKADERGSIYAELKTQRAIASKPEALALAVLEKQALDRAERRLAGLLADEILSETPTGQTSEGEQPLQGYGIPLPSDFADTSPSTVRSQAEKDEVQTRLIEKILARAKEKLPREYEEFMASKRLFEQLDRNLIETLGNQ